MFDAAKILHIYLYFHPTPPHSHSPKSSPPRNNLPPHTAKKHHNIIMPTPGTKAFPFLEQIRVQMSEIEQVLSIYSTKGTIRVETLPPSLVSFSDSEFSATRPIIESMQRRYHVPARVFDRHGQQGRRRRRRAPAADQDGGRGDREDDAQEPCLKILCTVAKMS